MLDTVKGVLMGFQNNNKPSATIMEPSWNHHRTIIPTITPTIKIKPNKINIFLFS